MSNCSWFSLLVLDGQLISVCLCSAENRSRDSTNFLNHTLVLASLWRHVFVNVWPFEAALTGYIVILESRLLECLLFQANYPDMYVLQMIVIHLFDRILKSSSVRW